MGDPIEQTAPDEPLNLDYLGEGNENLSANSEVEDLDATLRRLATMKPIEYERVRTTEAKRLRIRATELDRAVAQADVSEATEDLDVAIQRLAELQPIEYERVRVNEARRYKIRTTELDREVGRVRGSELSVAQRKDGFPEEVAPWPSLVDLADVLDDICTQVHRYVVCDQGTGIRVSLWIVSSWLIDNLSVAPILVISAPEKGCGKSTLLDLVSRLVRRPIVASNISPAALYRVIDQIRPTLLIDEADSFLQDNEALRGIINSGHTRASAYVWRVDGEDLEVVPFSTWGAKVISGIGLLAPTLMDRSIIAPLRRKLRTESCERLRHADGQIFDRLKSMLARIAIDFGHLIGAARPELPDALSDRAQDNWEGLLAIADLAGGDWPGLARMAALERTSHKNDQSTSLELLSDIRSIIESRKADWIYTADLLKALCEDETKAWAQFTNGAPISPRQLAVRLAPYGVYSVDIRNGHIVRKGYRAEDFAEVFLRYLPTSEASASSSQHATPQPWGDSERSA